MRNDAEDKEALVELCLQRCTFPTHQFGGTRFVVAACVTPTNMVIASGYAQNTIKDVVFIRDVADSYAIQQAKESAKQLLLRESVELLTAIVNGEK